MSSNPAVLPSRAPEGVRALTHARACAALLAIVAACAGAAIGLLPPLELAALTAGAIAAGLVLLTLAEPLAGLAVALVFAPFAPLENIMLGLPVDSGQAWLALAIGAWGLKSLYQRRTDLPAILSVRDRRFGWGVPAALALFVAVAAASFFAARSFELWAKETLKWLEVLAVCLIVAGERSPRRRAVLIGAILVSGAFQACLGIYQFGLRGEGPDEFAILDERYYRAYGTFEQPNPYGGYLGLVWPVAAGVALYLWHRAYRVVRRAYLTTRHLRLTQYALRPTPYTLHPTPYASLALAATAVAGLCLVALALSWSRGAWLGAAAAGLVMLIALPRRPIPSLILAGLAVALLAALSGAGALPAFIQSRLADVAAQFQSFDVRGAGITAENYAVIERLAHWQAAQNMILDRPYTGVGFGNFDAAYEQYRTYAWPTALGHAHNIYLNLWAETGLFGLLAYLALWITVIAATLRSAWSTGRLPRSAPRLTFAACLAIGLLGAWTHLAVHQLFDSLYVANTFLLLGAYLGLLESIRHSPISNL